MVRAGTILGPYSIEAVIGAGGLAKVWRAHHRETRQIVAVKLLNARAPHHEQRMVVEAKLQAGMKHPNIVQVHGMVYHNAAPALVMEYVRGPSLEHVLSGDEQLPLEQVERIGLDVLAGLAHAHERGLVHRDLKPSNVLLSLDGNSVVAKLADFGLAKRMGITSDTDTNVAMGTPAYMAPEQIRDAKNVDARADVYAAGAMLYEVLTSRRAFAQEDIVERYAASAEHRFIDTRKLRPEAPERLHRAIAKALSFDPAERPADGAQMLELWKSEQVSVPSSEEVFSERDRAALSAMRRQQQPPTLPPPMTRAQMTRKLLDEQQPQDPPAAHLVISGFIGGFLGMMLLAGLAWSQWERISTTPTPPTTVPAPAPVTPAPAEMTITEPATGEPGLAPQQDEATAPQVEPGSPPQPAQLQQERPQTQRVSKPRPAAPKPAPPPPPAPASSSPLAHVKVSGVAESWLESSDGERQAMQVAPGTYDLVAVFGGRPTRALQLELAAGEQVTVTCHPSFKICRRD